MTPGKKRPYRPKPMTQEDLTALEKKYQVPKEEIIKIAKSMGLGLRRLEMHLEFLSKGKK